jgi:glycosylphosphatidylinositol deacylase
MPTVDQSLSTYSHKTLRGLMLASFLVSFIPLPVDYYLGNEGEALFAPIAPVLLFIASGLVFVSWWVLTILMWSIGTIGTPFLGRSVVVFVCCPEFDEHYRRHRRHEERSVGRTSVVSMGLVLLLIFLFVPWQVAYLGCWLIHLFTCSTSAHSDSRSGPAPAHSLFGIPLIRVHDAGADNADDEGPSEITQDEVLRGPSRHLTHAADDRNNNMHLLLLMTWLLPLAAPVLAVWVRTLVTAGITTPFDGDHVFLNVAPFLILVDFASRNSRALERQRLVLAIYVEIRF